ncbi:hypothetical protein [Providencia sp. PROV130]|nr:hypothetical protein [Providencia sp. PROV130]
MNPVFSLVTKVFSFLVQKPPSFSAADSNAKDSPNNRLTAQTNIARAYQARPRICGQVRAFPDLIQQSMFEYSGNLKTVTELMCLGVGRYKTESVRFAESDFTAMAGASYKIYQPNEVIPQINEGFEFPDIDGQELPGPNESKDIPQQTATANEVVSGEIKGGEAAIKIAKQDEFEYFYELTKPRSISMTVNVSYDTPQGSITKDVKIDAQLVDAKESDDGSLINPVEYYEFFFTNLSGTDLAQLPSNAVVNIPDATEDTFAITYGAVNEYSNSYGKIHDIKVTVKDESSSVSLIKVNTTSRGAIMQDCTLHVGAGWCVTMEACFYYNYQNVTFEGRYIPKDEITAENELKGGAIRCVGTEINNIHFNNCDIRFLKTVFKGTGQFVGSNSLKVANAAIESIGDNLGNIYGWYVDFDCMYFEGIGLNKHNTDSLRYCFLGTGVGTANFNNCLINLGGTRKDKPIFSGTIGRVSLVRTQMNTSGRTAPIMEPITYSTRSMLEVDNSSCLPPSVVDSLGSQWVGGYRGEGATISPVVSASDIALNTFKFRMRPRIKINSYNNQLIGYVNFSTSIPVIVSIRVAGTIVAENTPKAVEFITYIKFVNGEQVGRSVSVITNGAPDLVGFNPQNGCTMSTYRTSEANNIRSFYLRVADLIGSSTQVDVFLDCEVSLIFESRDTRTSGVVSEY